MCCITRTSRTFTLACPTTPVSARWSTPGRAWASMLAWLSSPSLPQRVCFTTFCKGPTASPRKRKKARISSREERRDKPNQQRRAHSCAPLFGQRPRQSLDRGNDLRAAAGERAIPFPPKSLSLERSVRGWRGRTLAASLDGPGACRRLSRALPSLLLAEPAGVHRLRVGGAHSPRVERQRPVSAEIGKYNAGQKFVFWAQFVLVGTLLVTGIGLWEAGLGYFEQ